MFASVLLHVTVILFVLLYLEAQLYASWQAARPAGVAASTVAFGWSPAADPLTVRRRITILSARRGNARRT